MSSLDALTISPIEPDAGEEPVVRLDGVGVRYRVGLDPGISLKEYVVGGRRSRTIEHLALDGLDLDVRRGETLGIIGRNGAGKTTLLKVIARVLNPTTGRVRIHGRVAPLIDLFGAFHLELTGRENVFLNGALLGLSRSQVRERLDSIREFTEVAEFFDAPLRTYSAGMMVRLAFAVATSVDADILVIDEALGVGDAAFQEKCAERIDEFRSSGVTFIIVSHDVFRLREMCGRIAWIDAGKVVETGPAAGVVSRYLAAQKL